MGVTYGGRWTMGRVDYGEGTYGDSEGGLWE